MKTVKRTVKRKWFNKKTGKYVTRTYKYNGSGKSTRSKTLVTKSGIINKKNVENYIKEIKNNSTYSESEKRTLISDLNALVEQRHKDKKKLTVSGFLGKQQEDKISRFFVNAGYSVEEAAEEMEISKEDLLNEENWKDDTFTLRDDNNEVIGQWIFEFTYTGNFWRKTT